MKIPANSFDDVLIEPVPERFDREQHWVQWARIIAREHVFLFSREVEFAENGNDFWFVLTALINCSQGNDNLNWLQTKVTVPMARILEGKLATHYQNLEERQKPPPMRSKRAVFLGVKFADSCLA